jgi:hypothetical protein
MGLVRGLKDMKRGNPKSLTPKLQAELDALAAMSEDEVDTSEMPEIISCKGLRGALLHSDKQKLLALRAAIEKGMASGVAEPGTMDRIRKKYGLTPPTNYF